MKPEGNELVDEGVYAATLLRALSRTVQAARSTTGAAQDEKDLSSAQNQATFTPDRTPLGECRLISGRNHVFFVSDSMSLGGYLVNRVSESIDVGGVRGLFIVLMLGMTATASAAQETGFLTVQSEPEGVVISINGVAVGRAPYVNPFIETGVYSITASNGPDFPVQNKTVTVGAVEPVEVSFTFNSGLEGDFIGQKIEESRTEKRTGNVQIGSIPLGAKVMIAGASAGQAPFGYTQVEVGRYDIVFQSKGREIAGEFCIIAGETAKVVANFNDGSLVTNLAENDANCGFSAADAAAHPASLSSDPVVLVENLQTALKSVGCQAGVSDGIWGNKTKAAFDKYNDQRAGRCDALEPLSGNEAKDFNIFTLSANISALTACDFTICKYEKPPEKGYWCTGRVKSSPERSTHAFKQYRNATSGEAARERILQTLGKSGWIFTSLKCEPY